jgi:Flp pilus assembly protein TadD
LRLDPGLAIAKSNLAVVLAERGRIDEAILLMQDATRSASVRWEVYFNLGILLRMDGREGEALSALREAARLNPQDERIWRQLPGAGGRDR